jgi:NADH:ubiquinone oxidoreductase subunit 6 (subunit J)
MLDFVWKKWVQLAIVLVALVGVVYAAVVTGMELWRGNVIFSEDYRGQPTNSALGLAFLLVVLVVLIVYARKVINQK